MSGSLFYNGRLSRHGRLTATVTAAGWVASIAFLLSGWLGPAALNGLIYDRAVQARSLASQNAPEPSVIVVSVGQASLDSDVANMDRLPRTLFAPVWAKLVDASGDAGAESVSLDFVLNYNADLIRSGTNLPLYRSLASSKSRVILAGTDRTIPIQQILGPLWAGGGDVGNAKFSDTADGIVRVLPVVQRLDDTTMPPLAQSAIAYDFDSNLSETPWAPVRAPQSIPTYELSDVIRCAEDDPTSVQRALGGKHVFVGSTLPQEDIHFHAARFIKRKYPAAPQGGCLTPQPTAPASSLIHGVYIHASMAEQLMTGGIIQPVPRWVTWGLQLTTVTIVTITAMALLLRTALILWMLASATLFALAALMLGFGWRLELGLPYLSIIVWGLIAFGLRSVITDKAQQAIVSAFGKYLAPTVVAEYVEGKLPVAVHSQDKDISVMFADIAGFTSRSNEVSGDVLVREVNEALGVIVSAVGEERGYIDKFIGDAIMAFWGAPIDDDEHTYRMVRAVLAAQAEIKRRDGVAFSFRFGLTTGKALVGNVGTGTRLNYTAMGKIVNLSARLEKASGDYDASALLTEDVHDQIKEKVLCREVDLIDVRGFPDPVRVFEPLALVSEADPAVCALKSEYEFALDAFYRDDFTTAAAHWKKLAPRDPVSLARLRFLKLA